MSENGTYDQIGHVVCQAGTYTAGVNNCGTIQSVGPCLDNVLVRKVNYQSQGGDSGATPAGGESCDARRTRAASVGKVPGRPG